MSYKFLSNILRKNYLNFQRSSDYSVTQWLYSGLPMCLGPEIVYYTWLRAQLWSTHLLDARMLHSLNMKYSFPTYCPSPPAKEGNFLWKWGMIIYNPGTKLNWLPELKRKGKDYFSEKEIQVAQMSAQSCIALYQPKLREKVLHQFLQLTN